MFRITLYPEYFERRRRERQRTARTALLAGLVAVEVLLIGSVLLSGYLMGDRAGLLRATVRRLAAREEALSSPGPELQIAREIVTVRLRRTDWAPKLAALSEQIDPALKLVAVAGSVGGKGKPSLYELTGIFRTRAEETEAVTGFVSRLRDDGRVAGDFPDVRLGNVEWGGGGRFQVICESGRGGS